MEAADHVTIGDSAPGDRAGPRSPPPTNPVSPEGEWTGESPASAPACARLTHVVVGPTLARAAVSPDSPQAVVHLAPIERAVAAGGAGSQMDLVAASSSSPDTGSRGIRPRACLHASRPYPLWPPDLLLRLCMQ